MALTIEAPVILSMRTGQVVEEAGEEQATESQGSQAAESQEAALPAENSEASPSASSDGSQGPSSEPKTSEQATQESQEVHQESQAADSATECRSDIYPSSVYPPSPLADFIGSSLLSESLATFKFNQAVETAKLEIADAAVRHAKLVASTKSAKASFDEAIEELQELIAEGWEAFLPKKEPENVSEPGNSIGDEGDDSVLSGSPLPGMAGHSESTAASDIPVTDWADRPSVELIEHGAPKGVISTLAEHGYHTIGRIEKFRGEIALGHEKWPKGIGEAKITKLENAIVEWLTKNRDVAVFAKASEDALEAAGVAGISEEAIKRADAAVADVESAAPLMAGNSSEPAPEPSTNGKQVGLFGDPADAPAKPKRGRKKKAIENPESETPAEPSSTQESKPVPQPGGDKVPTFDRWESMSNDQQREWIIDRMAFIRTSETTAGSPVCFAGGRTACRNGHEPETCNWIPGPDMDAWLRGWMVEQSDIERRQVESKAATAKHRETVATGVDLDDL